MKKDDMKYWSGGKIILDAIKKNVKVPEKDKKYIIWRPRFFEIIDKVNPPKLRKGQKCHSCKKEIKKDWAYNGFWWHGKCKEKDSRKKIRKYLNEKET